MALIILHISKCRECYLNIEILISYVYFRISCVNTKNTWHGKNKTGEKCSSKYRALHLHHIW